MDGPAFSPLDPHWLPAPGGGADEPGAAERRPAPGAPAPGTPWSGEAFGALAPQPLSAPPGLAPAAVFAPPAPVPVPSEVPLAAPLAAPFGGTAVAGLAPAVGLAPVPVPPVDVAQPLAAPAPNAPSVAPVVAPVEAPPAGDAGEPVDTVTRVMGGDSSEDTIWLTDLLTEVLERGASDLHLTTGAPPTLRLNGQLMPMEDRPELTPPVVQKMLYSIITQKQRERFEEHLELDFAYAVPGKARFRVNFYRQRDALGAAFRLIPFELKPLDQLGVPASVANFAMLPRGFVLVTGPTGSGKSTTLAAIVDLANRQRRDHIMTVEDPIEFLHHHNRCLVNQREVGEDTHSFQNALKHVLRQDPDIILVGEMRDLETISVALTAAETGHLVFATLHTQDAAQTIDRIIDVFPPHQQQQIRVQLAGALQGVVCQTLCRTFDGRGRVVATEILVATPAIRNLIREGKTHQIYSAMQAGGKFGMATMDQHLAELVKTGKVSYENALEKCHHVEDFNRLCGRS